MSNWIAPSPEEIRGFLKQHNLTGAKAGELVKVNSRQVRRWTGGDSKIPYSAWYVWHIEMTGKKPE